MILPLELKFTELVIMLTFSPSPESPFPFLDGKGFIVLGKLAGHHKLSIELEITPFFDHAHGILLFSSQHANGTGDFLSLALIDGYARRTSNETN